MHHIFNTILQKTSFINFLSRFWAFIILLWLSQLLACQEPESKQKVVPDLQVSENKRYLTYQDGNPFFWLGGTSWGMSEWLSREEIELYLDNRKEKGFNLIQICLFWGKRTEDPVNFQANQPNFYGFKAFQEKEGITKPTEPLQISGGTPQNSNDYWDHVKFILSEAKERNMIVAIMPVWGRRYVNNAHPPFSSALFSVTDMFDYGKFLGSLLEEYTNIIWVMGGDVQADKNGDFLGHYRSMAEGIIFGLTGKKAKWNERSPLWNQALMTYHPDGVPLLNSSKWFHKDAWLDFNMIETFKHRDQIYQAVQQDYDLKDPIKPTVMGEPAYEWSPTNKETTQAIHMRRQAYQSYFAGAAGFTYGGFRDDKGNGPLFSPTNNWETTLDWEGAQSMKWVRAFCTTHFWPTWKPISNIFSSDPGSGELQKVAVLAGKEILIYFPENSSAELDLKDLFTENRQLQLNWYNPVNGTLQQQSEEFVEAILIEVTPPEDWEDAILVISEKVG